MQAASKLHLIKAVHTLVWAVFALSILAIPVASLRGRLALAWALIVFVLGEVMVLVANRMRCPLTGLAARYTKERQDNFDIYLPLWLARHNKLIFGSLYALGFLCALWASVRGPG